MAPRLATALLLLLLLLAFAFAPVLRSGLLADDYAWLLAPALDAVPGPEPAWMAALWTRASRALWGIPEPGQRALAFRLENLAVLLATALCLRAASARLLAPWMGVAPAARAASLGALLFVFHPSSAAAVASLSARGELAALFLCSAAAALFLRGRQEGLYVLTSVSLGLVVLAACAAPLARAWPALLAGAEYLSAHRYRRRSSRVRTALTTLVVFGAGAALPLLVAALGGPPQLAASAGGGFPTTWEALRAEAAAAVEELGLLVLPSNPELLGAGGSVLAGALFLCALQPAFRAASHAPRLWGGVLLSWVISFALVWLARTGVRASGAGFDLAWSALPAASILGLGLGIAASARSGLALVGLSSVLFLGFAALGHANARPRSRATDVVRGLRRDLTRARALREGAPVLVLEPPGAVDGVDPLHGALAWLAHPALDESSAPFDPLAVRGLSTRAFLEFSEQEEFEELREAGVIVLAPAPDGGPRAAVLVTAGAPSGGTRSWRRELRSPVLDLDPFEFDTVRVTAGLESSPAELARVAWRTKNGEGAGSAPGVVLEQGGGRLALFDLSRSLDWRLGGRVHHVVFEHGNRPIEEAEVLEELPELGVPAPEVDGADWTWPSAGLALPAPGGTFALTLFSLAELECLELALEPGAGGELRASGAARFARRALELGEPLAWSLDYRIDGQALARARGRMP